MRILQIVGTTFLAAVAFECSAGLKEDPVTLQSGNWKVIRSIDSMKDSVNCTGIYKDNYGTQLTEDQLYISVKGGIQSVKLRFGDDPPSAQRLATTVEKQLNSIVLSKTEVGLLRAYDRIRFQAGVLIGGMAEGEITLSGYSDALAHIRDKCPMPKIEPIQVVSPAVQPQVAPTCSEIVISRMKAAKLKESQITAICK